MKQLFLAILGWFAFSIMPIIGMEQATKKQATVAEAPELLALAPELADEQFRNAVASGSASKVLELLNNPRGFLEITLSDLYPCKDMWPLLNEFVEEILPGPSVSVLHLAAARGHTDVADILIEHGALVDILDSNKMTPLMWAAQEGHVAIVKLLIDAGANDEIETDIGDANALDLACKELVQYPSHRGLQEVVEYFVESGWNDVNFLNYDFILERPNLVALLLARGGLVARPAEDEEKSYNLEWGAHRRMSPLEYAKARNLPSYKLLREADACDNLILGAKAARRTIFAALCTFQRLNATFLKDSKLPKDVIWRSLIGSNLREDFLKGAAYVRKEHRRNYEYLMETIQKRCGKLFSIAEILAFFVRNSY